MSGCVSDLLNQKFRPRLVDVMDDVMNMIVAARRIAATTGPAVAACCSTTGSTASSSTRDIVMGDNNLWSNGHRNESHPDMK